MSNRTNGLYEFGSFRLDAAKRLLTRAGESVTLAPKTFDLLLLLAESQGRALTKAELMQALWPDTFVEEANLSFQMSALRKALGEEGSEWIETVPKHGYRFTAAVTKVAMELDAPAEPAARSPVVPARRLSLVPWAVAALCLLAATVFAVAYFRRPPPEDAAVTKFALLPPENTSFNEIVVSPDGRRVAFTAQTASGATQLWVRPLDSLSAQPLAGTEGASLPFWSPDSRSLGFFAAGKLRKVEASGGPPQTLCNAPLARGGAWSREGVMIFGSNNGTPLYRLSAAGGELQPVTALDRDRQENGHLWPHFLPDGKHFLFVVRSSQPENTGIYLASLDRQSHTRLLGTTSSTAYASGYLLFLRERTLLAQPFDLARLATAGEAVPVAEPVQPDFGRARFSVSQSGVLVYDSKAVAFPVGSFGSIARANRSGPWAIQPFTEP